ncbi:O-methyltransferase [Paenibacillus flagellatus]|uniref:O-methyltransferase n=1 Tax=Paenibacillus flagellatus TaxID=2211139 RepID=A0A2V5JVP4_9BACL|nr:O-methyltransferase [Paenibacillus flagellatus]PYI50815.1 O-methyltransferase [Paenibacillus flagellatus]
MIDQLSLSRQLDMVFRELQQELSQLSSGTIFVHIRNNLIGKFGVRHLPLEAADGKVEPKASGLTALQVRSFQKMAVDALKYKTNWTHGEIHFDFTVRQNKLCTSVQFESNYNMSNLLFHKTN